MVIGGTVYLLQTALKIIVWMIGIKSKNLRNLTDHDRYIYPYTYVPVIIEHAMRADQYTFYRELFIAGKVEVHA